MRLDEKYKSSFVISYEVFPPKTPLGEDNMIKEMKILSAFKPGFISVTYGAGGSSRDKTLELSLKIRDTLSVEPLVHFTCVGAGRTEINEYIEKVRACGITNILALRGDPPEGQGNFIPAPDGFSYASELVTFIRGMSGFTIGVAGYPEGHIEASDREADLINLKKKVDAGADFIITQLFYDNSDFYDFMDRARRIGIHVPVVPGIMPVTGRSQIEKITKMCGAKIPPALEKSLSMCGSAESICEAGIEYSTRQCEELKSWGVPGFHFYPLNKSAAVRRIIEDGGFA
jgi:methylenetetrahydrofolate reductase (NADPH)